MTTDGGYRDLRVERKETVADDIVAITLAAADGSALPPWQAGAHVDVHLPGGVIRQYSLCGDPTDRTRYRLAVLREPDGRGGSATVHDKVGVGDTLRISWPRNHFALVASPAYLFIAGGVGITAILPMLAEVERRGAGWRLLYGGRRRTSMTFLDELAGYGDKVTLRPQDEYGLLDLKSELAVPRPATVVYCCGPEPLLRAVEEHCEVWPDQALHLERFAPKAIDPCAADDEFDIELASTGRRFVVPRGQSILSVLEHHGIAVLSSCQEGTCGTCETGVLAGVPDHRDSVLTRAEQAGGDIMMICVSRARTQRLVLDL